MQNLKIKQKVASKNFTGRIQKKVERKQENGESKIQMQRKYIFSQIKIKFIAIEIKELKNARCLHPE